MGPGMCTVLCVTLAGTGPLSLEVCSLRGAAPESGLLSLRVSPAWLSRLLEVSSGRPSVRAGNISPASGRGARGRRVCVIWGAYMCSGTHTHNQHKCVMYATARPASDLVRSLGDRFLAVYRTPTSDSLLSVVDRLLILRCLLEPCL
ncbi:hypothetical protein NDU88_005365 [Pleurodeles waltl]|uniref:Secreted protein n=1 Tax=Pleurodeles waltl TaxID=8319 RepID=A0AAV7LRX8_PLEWA|nr:hypothetical protein NDU88_005365 [Pleurodeles waltl]